ncbi:MAG: DUF4419 domain-containing protein [Planctomycetota bacterium]|nr:MAG: DUF4419 domain-containing protein [Planctomycetota bacterium]
MNTLASTFAVSNVTRATDPLAEVPYYEAIERLLNQRPLSEEANATATIEACSRYHGRLVSNVHAHPVIVAVHRAFMQHRPLCLSPDMIWLLICQGVANHVNAHAEDLRSRFVTHQGKAKIKVCCDDFIKGSPENSWGEVVDSFSAGVREHIGSTHDLFVPHFSTTGPTERIAAEIVLLDAMQSYFEYIVETLCGIPEVTLEGTVDDWQSIADRAQLFAEFGLEWWLTALQPILLEFAATARGEDRMDFWESIYKFQSMSGGATITGWITAFFPYVKDRQDGVLVRNRVLVEGWENTGKRPAGEFNPNDFSESGLSPGHFPSGLARAPFVWEYLGKNFDMEFLGGFVGVAQDSATLALRPEIGWAIRDVTSV